MIERRGREVGRETKDDVRSVRHALHTSGNDDTPLLASSEPTEHHALRSEGDGLETGRADLVDGRGIGGLGDARGEEDLACGRLAGTSLNDLRCFNQARKEKEEGNKSSEGGRGESDMSVICQRSIALWPCGGLEEAV